ncbi:hypothetical protein OG21DRAFT_1411000 [Imleria badia]|nr:hypothetical protein OG21DRAFT_1411000 [Imleria badia]
MIVNDLQALRTVGVALDTLRCRGVIIAHLKISCPVVFEHVAADGSHFQCSESWVKKFVVWNLNWSFRHATCAAQKTPATADQLCLDQFYQLSLTIRDCAIFHPCFYVNLDQTNIVYQPANATTYKEVGSSRSQSLDRKKSVHLLLLLVSRQQGTHSPSRLFTLERLLVLFPQRLSQHSRKWKLWDSGFVFQGQICTGLHSN